jgi:hypothetical protein
VYLGLVFFVCLGPEHGNGGEMGLRKLSTISIQNGLERKKC